MFFEELNDIALVKVRFILALFVKIVFKFISLKIR